MRKVNSVRRTPAVAESIERRLMMSAVPHGHMKFRVAEPTVGAVDTVQGLTGTYYLGTHFRNPVLTRTDDDVNFQWNDGAPAPSLVGHPFSARWTGQITPSASQAYTFTSVSDDGVRLWIGGKLVINNWRDQYATEAFAGHITLQAGRAYDIRLDYYENGNPPASVTLYWSSPGQAKGIVPPWAFHTAPPSPSVGTAPHPTVGGTAPVAPAAPINLAAVATSTSQIHLSWTGASGATGGYMVERSPNGQGNWATVGTTAAGVTQFDDGGLSAGTTYFYRVVAESTAGASPASNLASARTQDVVYALTNGGTIDSINTTTGQTTQLGTLLFGTAAADRDPMTGRFYYIEINTSTPRVAVFDPSTGTNTVLSTIMVSGTVMRAAFNAAGTLYITAGDGDLYTIDTLTGAAMFVGTFHAGGQPLPSTMGDMAFDAAGNLYLESVGTLYTVDLASLTATRVGDDGSVGNVQIAFGSDDLLYGLDSNGGFYTINTATGAATPIATTDIYLVGDLTGPVI